MKTDSFGALDTLDAGQGPVSYYRLRALERAGLTGDLDRLPFSIKVLLESVLRNVDGELVTETDVRRLAAWNAARPAEVELPFMPARVILQDFTGVPAVVDLASMRSAVKRLGGDARRINPLVPVDLVVDHSVQVDVFGTRDALAHNAEMEFGRNRERYEFLKWGAKSFQNFRVVPPATGIVHQVNLEYLAQGVMTGKAEARTVAFPDTLVGTDSHTTMINGLGVLGWGVGGIEAEAAMLGQPLYMLTPQVVGFRLTGKLREGVTATDLVLTVTQMLRKKGVVEKFVEFFGPGLGQMSLADRATIANMAPEYGATCGFFPVDDETLRYLRRTGRNDQAALVERYGKEQGLFRTDAAKDPIFSDTLALDMDTVEPSLAGPKRPQDRVALAQMKTQFAQALTAPVKDRGFGLSAADLGKHGHGGHEREEDGDRARRRRHRRHHELHEHLEPVRDARRGPPGQEGGRARPAPARPREDQPGPRLEGGHRVLQPVRLDAPPREPRLQRGGLRVHDLHRQQRAPARGRAQGGHRRQARGLIGAVREPQLRGAHQPGREGELPRFASPRRRLRPGRIDRDRPHQGASGNGARRKARLPFRHLAEPAGGGGAGGAHQREDVRDAPTPTCSTATRPGTR